MSNDKTRLNKAVTLIEDPYGLNTLEISDAQNDSEELDLDVGSESESESELEDHSELVEESSEQLDDQLEKLAQAIADQAVADQAEAPAPAESDPEAELAAQIAEDQALEEAMDQAQESAQDEPAAPTILDEKEIQSCLEAILFISDKPLSLDKLRGYLGPDFTLSLFQEAIAAIQERYQAVHHGIELIEVAGGYQFRTKPGRASLAQKLVKTQTQRLSSGAMESLAITAYKQPIMKEEIDKIRGVDSSYFIRGLIDKKLIKISGRSELPGRPILYSTTEEFLQLFGLKDLSSLPSLRELEQMIPGSQSSNPEDEDPRIRDMRRLVGEMKADQSSALHYNPKEDEKILKEIKERVTAIPTSTPYLDEVKAAELLAKQEQLQAQDPQLQPQPEAPVPEKTPS